MLRKRDFYAMEQSVTESTIGMPEDTGISVTLWKLRELLKGYRWAVDRDMYLEDAMDREAKAFAEGNDSSRSDASK